MDYLFVYADEKGNLQKQKSPNIHKYLVK
jgi:hypothetical protein